MGCPITARVGDGVTEIEPETEEDCVSGAEMTVPLAVEVIECVVMALTDETDVALGDADSRALELAIELAKALFEIRDETDDDFDGKADSENSDENVSTDLSAVELEEGVDVVVSEEAGDGLFVCVEKNEFVGMAVVLIFA